MEKPALSYQNMSPMDYNFEKFYRNWAFAAALINLIGVILAVFYDTNLPWLIGSCVIFLLYMSKIPMYSQKLPLIIGYANWISIIRLGIVIIAFSLYTYYSDIILFILFFVAISLDGLDGYVARKFKQTSLAGEKLDMEIDAYLVLVLSWIHVDQKSISYLILIPGGMRYFYEIGFFWINGKGVNFPPKFIRATIAVLFFLSLLTPFILDTTISETIIAISGVLIILSFTLSVTADIFNMLKKNINRGI